MKTTQGIAGGIEEGLEGGIWGGVKGALLGYMTLPIVAGALTGLALGLGWFGAPIGVGSALLIGAAATVGVAVLGYPLNKQVAKLGGLIGGVVGFTQGVDEPETGPVIQLGKDQELVVIDKSRMNMAAVNANAPSAQIDTKDAQLAAQTLSLQQHQRS